MSHGILFNFSADDSTSYVPISVLSTAYKVMEHMNRIGPTVNANLPKSKLFFNCTEVAATRSQTSLWTSRMESNENSRPVLLSFICQQHMTQSGRMLLKLAKVIACVWILRLLNTVGYHQALCFLFNVCMSDTPETIVQKFAYADDLALTTQAMAFKNL